MVDPKEYELAFFKENDFIRKKCKLCGRHFWTQDHDREVCGDSPCAEYTFLGNPPTRRKYTLAEMRETFLRFFEKNGHTRIKRYPVIARWRDDVFLTIASIACFQPHVTSGEVPPPYNPLVMSQPSIRLTDVDNVGKTGGRHLTIFEMMAHHAFNSKDKFVYWKDKTVEYHHIFLTEVLGIEPEEVAYIEHWWEGGGDAGPDVEGVVRGLEISTLVFMQYRKANGGYVELPIKIVDTGYGLERFTWLSAGTPTAFEAIFGGLVDKFMHLASTEPINNALLVEAVKQAGAMNVSDLGSKLAARRVVARKVNLDPIELDRMLSPIEDLYAILDHTKALLFMLSDGIVPSNVRAGYLARFLIRRTLRLMRKLGISTPLADLMSLQLNHWSEEFPELKHEESRILEVIELEQQRYDKIINEGRSVAQKVIKELSRKGLRKLPTEKLAELYDSHGVPPEVVKEVGLSLGIDVDVPDNFDSIVASRHAGQSRPEEGVEPLSWVEGIKPTRTLYYEEPGICEFKAKVIHAEGDLVVLDQTAFYPEGGGQLHDLGILRTLNSEVKVVDVKKFKDVVVHRIEGPPLKSGEEVTGIIDVKRRRALMRHHTATHVILGAARRVLGEHVWQEGAQKGADKSRLDISHYKRISSDQVRQIERLANLVVLENRPVNVLYVDRNEAERRYGFRLYQGGVVPGKLLRVVEIPGWDVEACGGLHCKSTGELGFIKIISAERIQDGVERLEFAAGEAALDFVVEQERKLVGLAERLNSPIEQLEAAAEKLIEENKALRKENERLLKIASKYKSEEALAKAKVLKGIRLAYYYEKGLSREELMSIASNTASRGEDVLAVVLTSDQQEASFVVLAGSKAAEHVDAGLLARKLAELLGGKGGGRQDFGQGSGRDVDKVKYLPRVLEDLLR